MPTATQWMDLDGVGQRTLAFRFDFVSSDLERTGEELSVRRDASVTISNNTQDPIKRLMSLALLPGALSGLDLYSTLVRPVCVLPEGTEKNMGVFMFAKVGELERSYGNEGVVEMMDQCLVLDQPVPNTIAFNAGVSIKAALESLFGSAGIRKYVVSVDGVLPSPVAWEPDTSRLEIMNALAALAGGHQVYFDNDGWGRVIPIPAADDADIVYSLETARVYRDSIFSDIDTVDAPNRYVVISGDATELPVFGIYDIPDAAPHSIVNRNGRIISHTETLSGIADHAAAAAAARAIAVEEAASYGGVQFTSVLDPRHDTFDVVDFYGTLYRSTSWSATLTSEGPMVHDMAEAY